MPGNYVDSPFNNTPPVINTYLLSVRARVWSGVRLEFNAIQFSVLPHQDPTKYSDNQKTLELEDDFKNQVITLKSQMNTNQRNKRPFP